MAASTGAKCSMLSRGVVPAVSARMALNMDAPVSPTKVRRRTGSSSSCSAPRSTSRRSEPGEDCKSGAVSRAGMAAACGRGLVVVCAAGGDTVRGARPRAMRAESGMCRPSAMRSNRASVRTCCCPRMMSLTLPWLIAQAMPIWVWLAPAYWPTSWNSRPMSRVRKAAMVSARCQNEPGIVIKSLARPGMRSLFLRKQVSERRYGVTDCEPISRQGIPAGDWRHAAHSRPWGDERRT